MIDNLYAGIDLGGTNIKFGLFTQDGKLCEKWQVPTGEKSPAAIFSKIAEEIRVHAALHGSGTGKVRSVGIGVPGSVDANGKLLDAPNLGWKNLDCAQSLRQWLDIPVFVANDANVAALGEQAYGIGATCSSLVFVTLGTGVGGGVIIDGKLVSGCFGGAGEIGHMVINPQEKNKCSCGKYGCLEQYVSATGLVRMARRMSERTGKSSVFYHMEELTAKNVFDAVRDKDAAAIAVADTFGDILGRAFALISAVVDPEMFVIGGGVSAAGEILTDYVGKYYRKYAFTPSIHTPIRLAALGNDAGIYGAVRMAVQHCDEK